MPVRPLPALPACRPPRWLAAWLVAIAVVAALASCSTTPSSSPGANTGSSATLTSRPTVAVTTDVVGSLVTTLVGGDADVVELLPRGAVPATTRPSDELFERARAATLMVAVGGGWEPWLSETRTAPTLELAPLLNPIPAGGSELSATSSPTDAIDPRFWLDPDRTTQAVRRIADQLVAIGLDRAAVQARVDTLTSALARADEAAQSSLGAVPEDHRTLLAPGADVSYLADRYGFTIATVPPANGAPDARPAVVVIDAATARTTGTAVPAVAASLPVAVLHLDALAPTGVPGDVPSLIETNGSALAAALG